MQVAYGGAEVKPRRVRDVMKRRRVFLIVILFLILIPLRPAFVEEDYDKGGGGRAACLVERWRPRRQDFASGEMRSHDTDKLGIYSHSQSAARDAQHCRRGRQCSKRNAAPRAGRRF